jgi:hypothetical protein
VVLTLIAYILFVLATILVSLYPTIIVAKAYLKKSLSSVAFRELVANSRSLTIIIPSKGEAVPLVIKNLAKLSSMQCIDDSQKVHEPSRDLYQGQNQVDQALYGTQL